MDDSTFITDDSSAQLAELQATERAEQQIAWADHRYYNYPDNGSRNQERMHR